MTATTVCRSEGMFASSCASWERNSILARHIDLRGFREILRGLLCLGEKAGESAVAFRAAQSQLPAVRAAFAG